MLITSAKTELIKHDTYHKVFLTFHKLLINKVDRVLQKYIKPYSHEK